MKKNYTAPEAKLLSFISAERLATNADIDFDVLLGAAGGSSNGNGTEPSTNDISLPLT